MALDNVAHAPVNDPTLMCIPESQSELSRFYKEFMILGEKRMWDMGKTGG